MPTLKQFLHFASICSVLSFTALSSSAQVLDAENRSATIKNNAPLAVTNSVVTPIQFNNKYVVEKVQLPFHNVPTVSLSDVQTEVITNYTIQEKLTLDEAFTPIVTAGFEQKKSIAYVQIPQYINSNGQILKLVKYKINVTNGTEIKKTRANRTYAANSVLASGKWQKIAITETGIHKIDYNFVKNTLGVTPENINTSLIKVCGNGGGMLSENNAVIPLDDIQQTALKLVGMEDNKWDANDYILFYAKGPHEIVKDSINKKFTHAFNIYNNAAYYFVNFDAGAGIRVNAQASIAPANIVVSTFHDYVFHEKDSINVGSVGKIWWGEILGNKIGLPLSQTFNFSLPNLVADSNVIIETYFGNKSINTGATFKVNAKILESGITTAQTNYDVSVDKIGSSLYAPFVTGKLKANTIKGAGSQLSLDVQYNCPEDQAYGYIDYLAINAQRNLVMSGSQMQFSNWNSIGATNVAEYKLTSSANPIIWDVTNAQNPESMLTTATGNQISFKQVANTLHQFIAFDGVQFATPTYVGAVANQNLHNAGIADYLIVVNPAFKAQAQTLATLHNTNEGLRPVIVTTDEIYNEFASGSQDISAIRNFAKMYYDKAINPADLPKYLLLFGDASYDYKDRVKDNTNYVPSRESDESMDKTAAYVSDDFFAMLDDNENIKNNTVPNTLDIGVGRFVCKTTEEAATLVQKVVNYYSPNSFGDWRLNQTFCADDRDYGQHVVDAEVMSKTASLNQPIFNNYKIYVDAFPIYATPAGNRAPQAKQAIDAQIFNGALMINYNGHGGTTGWCEERILNTADISDFNNINKMPIFITATCDFAPFDNPKDPSCGEQLFLHKKGGAIALLTTTAVVYQYQNQIMNRDYWAEGFKPMANGNMPALGDALRLSKNRTYNVPDPFDNFTNFRKFVLLGDPALMPAFAKQNVVLDSVNGKQLGPNVDTFKALNAYKLKGHISDSKTGALLSNFNGTVSITIFDKSKTLTTLQNVEQSTKVNYSLQNAIVFKGAATVIDGKWSIYFIVPKDIDYSYGNAKISMYAHNGIIDAAGAENSVKIGGSGLAGITDNKGPDIKPFINNNKFINGGITSPNSTLYVELFDENGINTTGSSVGHDVIAYLDDNTKEPIILNNFYEGTKDNYKSGVVRYPFKNLSEGAHTLTVRAWDVVNNSSTASVDFVVSNTNTAKLDRLFNVPNPFSTNTNFTFEHNFPNEPLYVTIQIFTTSGQIVKTIQQYVQSEGSRIDNISWDGKDQMGDILAKGVYLYRVYYKTVTGISTSKYQKLVIF